MVEVVQRRRWPSAISGAVMRSAIARASLQEALAPRLAQRVDETRLDQAAEFHWQDSPCGLEASRLAVAIAERLPASVYP